MAQLNLVLKEPSKAPLELSNISPDVFCGKSLSEVEALTVWRGNRKLTLKDIFEIYGESCSAQIDLVINISGDLSKSRRIGYGMSNGNIIVNGNGGLCLGEGMKGGSIVVSGDAGSWTGAEMKGGKIDVHGSVEDQVGSSYRGGRHGMSGGMILVHGQAGGEVGCWMKGGTIRIGRSAGLFAGVHMQGGTILLEGDSLGRLGAQMVNGRVVLMGRVEDILSGFMIEEIRPSAKVDGDKITGPFYTFTGDLTERGVGRLFISVSKNPHLKVREKFLW